MAEAVRVNRQGSRSPPPPPLSPRLYIDVAPLQEVEFTGIPQVVAKLCEEMLGDDQVEPGFFYNRHEIPVWLVSALLKERNGSLLRWGAGRYAFSPVITRARPGQSVFGLHTNMKFARRAFPVEGQIVHDLTTLVTPQHHTPDTNEYHQSKFFGDLMSDDIIFAVSRSTALDIADFYPDAVAATPLVVAHLGVDWSHIPPAVLSERVVAEPYVFVLGTLEPRKNMGVVLERLAQSPALAERYRFVFGGRVGWGDGFERRVERLGLTALAERGRIVQTGFVSEAVKYRLLKNARAVVYPSVYEGFGLPLAEAIHLGVPTVTTASSSLPEVGREFAHYFDPARPESFASALDAALERSTVTVSRTGETLDAWREYFSWRRCYGQIRDGFLRLESRA